METLKFSKIEYLLETIVIKYGYIKVTTNKDVDYNNVTYRHLPKKKTNQKDSLMNK